MNNVAQTFRADRAISVNYLLPLMLAANTAALLAFDHIVGIPNWVKSAAAIFLTF